MTPFIASLILTGLDLAVQVERNRNIRVVPEKQMPQAARAAETVEQFRQILANAIRENRGMSEDEINFWHDRINQNRQELQRRARDNPAGRVE